MLPVLAYLALITTITALLCGHALHKSWTTGRALGSARHRAQKEKIMTSKSPRLFHLQRDHDISGVSGTGRVADGVLWPDDTVSLRWTGARPSVVFWDRLEDAEHIHGHGGATHIVWADELPAADRAALREQLLRALYVPYCQALGYKTSDQLLAAYDAAQQTAALRDAAADQTAEIEQLRTENGRLRHELEVVYGGAFDSLHTAQLRRLAAGAQQPTCAECGHPHTTHRPGDDPVTPGTCTACPDDDDRHDYQQPTAGAQQQPERCVHCTHPKRDHDGRADHREKFSPLVAGQPWCHACNAACDYAGAQQQPTTETPQPDTCRSVDVDGQPVLVRGRGDFTEQDAQFFGEVVRAAKRRYEAEHGPVVDEDAQRTTRRDSLHNLLARLERHWTLSSEERALLRQHVEAEISEAAVLRGDVKWLGPSRRTWKARAEEIEQIRDNLAAELERANAVVAETKRLMERRTTTLRTRAEQAEQERDGAYRERAHLVALLAAMTDNAVIAPAPDVAEPGWGIAYLTLGGRQASWHISPRDADLFQHVTYVGERDPRAQWDGHTTEEKYAGIAAWTAELAQDCGPACAEQHTETGRCVIARNR